MDGVHFDRLTQALARQANRRTVMGVAAAVGLHPILAAAKKKNTCRGGCGDCKVCKNKKNSKKCVPVADGAACPGGTCRGGVCDTTCTGCTECQTCPNGACVSAANGTPCTNGVCTDGVCGCGDACCGTTYCPPGGDLTCLANDTCAELCYPTSCPKGCGCVLAVGAPKCVNKSFAPQDCSDIPSCVEDASCGQGRFCAVLPVDAAGLCGYPNGCEPVCPKF